MAKDGYKVVPQYWWDFDDKMRIMVESSHPDYDFVCYAATIDDAERVIADLISGRKNLKSVSQTKL